MKNEEEKSREAIITEALLVQIDTSVPRADFFSAWEVLTVARIGKEDIKKAAELYRARMNMQEILNGILVH